MGGRGGVADGIEHGAAADREHVGVTAQPRVLNDLQDLVDMADVVLDRFPSGHDQDRRGESHDVVMRSQVARNLIEQVRVRIGDAAIDDGGDVGRGAIGARA